ncbi:hypothetical protein BDK51DRAFT_43958 [Blyttiomyces helicus]|uniref:Uncharacterized protein n=1 Tax=Blyttiomyces helicus TaxID=388810 RepID=A0A4P9W1H0_9FUNG|nr:hypothetical protein BDK51DRAFT_43958 [Blyttiomyces helicus]|eukprot:RKO85195.1 hypothetical protein BDK51DRAFT_43958 [Blyttiomyces helicus]
MIQIQQMKVFQKPLDKEDSSARTWIMTVAPCRREELDVLGIEGQRAAVAPCQQEELEVLAMACSAQGWGGCEWQLPLSTWSQNGSSMRADAELGSDASMKKKTIRGTEIPPQKADPRRTEAYGALYPTFGSAPAVHHPHLEGPCVYFAPIEPSPTSTSKSHRVVENGPAVARSKTASSCPRMVVMRGQTPFVGIPVKLENCESFLCMAALDWFLEKRSAMPAKVFMRGVRKETS